MSSGAGGGPTGVATDDTRFPLGAALTRAGIPQLCAELADRLRGGRGPGAVVLDVTAVARPDAVTAEALARLCLTARRHGRAAVLAGAGPELLELLDLLGLADLLDRP